MSQENVWPDRRAQVEAALAALNARDFDTFSDLPLHPGAEFRSIIGAAEGRVYHGVQGMREWAHDMDSVFDGYRSELVEFREVDEERAFVVVRVTATAKVSGVPLDLGLGQVWTWQNGLMWRNDVYTDVRQALEAVGLTE